MGWAASYRAVTFKIMEKTGGLLCAAPTAFKGSGTRKHGTLLTMLAIIRPLAATTYFGH